MSEFVLLRCAASRKAALYIDGMLGPTWDKHDPEKDIQIELDMRAGDTEVAERAWDGGPWPEELPAKLDGKAPAKPKRVPAPAEDDPSADTALEGQDAD